MKIEMLLREYQELTNVFASFEQKLNRFMAQAERQREILLNNANKVFIENLWILPLVAEFQENEEVFAIDEIWFDPEDYQQRDSKVFYNKVQVEMSDKLANIFLDLVMTLKPFDVHNETMTGQVVAEEFVSKFKKMDYIQEAVQVAVQEMSINEI